jgi:hypothetical protein
MTTAILCKLLRHHRYTAVDLWVGYCERCGKTYDDTPDNAAEIIGQITRLEACGSHETAKIARELYSSQP